MTNRIRLNSNICKKECSTFYSNPTNTNLGGDIEDETSGKTCGKCIYWDSAGILGDCSNGMTANCCSCNGLSHLHGEYNFCDVSGCLLKKVATGKNESGCSSSFLAHFGTSDPNIAQQIFTKMGCNKSSMTTSVNNEDNKVRLEGVF